LEANNKRKMIAIDFNLMRFLSVCQENIHVDQETDVLRAAVQLGDDRQRYHLTVVLDCRCTDQLRLLRVPKVLQTERQAIATIGWQVLTAALVIAISYKCCGKILERKILDLLKKIFFLRRVENY